MTRYFGDTVGGRLPTDPRGTRGGKAMATLKRTINPLKLEARHRAEALGHRLGPFNLYDDSLARCKTCNMDAFIGGKRAGRLSGSALTEPCPQAR